MSKSTVIVSDLHIGSPFFLHEHFSNFLDRLSDQNCLVLNGDTIDNPKSSLSTENQEVVDRLVDASHRLKIIWLQGNHDESYRLPSSGKIEYKISHTIGKRLVIFHGHDFDNVMPYHYWFIRCFKFFHDFRIKIGAPPIHVAHYAKKWSSFYKYLRKNIMMNAVEYCKEHGFEAVTCGHVHFPEDIQLDGIRYLNTGSWTEDRTYHVLVTENEILFKQNEFVVAPESVLE